MRVREQLQRSTERSKTPEKLAQIRFNDPVSMTQSMYAGKPPSPFRSPLRGDQSSARPSKNQLADDKPGMSQSVILIPKQSTQSQNHLTFQNERNETDSNDMQCPSCEEDRASCLLLPCKHTFCQDCSPSKKMKRKVCPECKGDVTQVIDIPEA